MDVAKYIGLFLLKNNFCYIHGLGNLELKRKPASYNGSALLPPSYDVHLSPSGSIDDNLANFIASNEQISISKASNALRDFSTQARADLSAGREVGIPAIGKFFEEEGKIRFSTDPHFKHSPAPIQATKVAKNIEQAPVFPTTDTQVENSNSGRPYVPVHTPSDEEEEDEETKLNWPRIILATIVILALAAIITFAVKKYSGGEDTLQPVLPTKENANQLPVQPIPQVTDSTSMVDSNATPVTMPAGSSGQVFRFKAIIDSYTKRESAEKRIKQMRGYGKNVELVIEDTNKFFVVMPIECALQDTAKVLDSLTRWYNPGGVTIY